MNIDNSQFTPAGHSAPLDGTENLAQEPPVADSLPMYPLDTRFIQVEVIGGMILTAAVSLMGAVGLSVLWISMGFGTVWFVLVACALGIVGVLIFFTFVWPKIEFRHYRWRLDEQSLEIHRGVWFQHRISVPLGRVQHADVSQGPLLRRFDLGKLTIHTAGTSNAQIELSGLSHELALQLRDRLVQQTQSRVVT